MAERVAERSGDAGDRPDRHRTGRRRRRGGRIVLLGLAALFLMPVLAAIALNFYLPGWRPGATVNHGTLLEPRRLASAGLRAEAGAAAPGDPLRGTWTLLAPVHAPCEQACRDALVRMRQARLALGRHRDAVGRLAVRAPGATLPAEVRDAHPGLAAVRAERDWLEALGGPAANGHLYLVDPNGFLVMHFAPAVGTSDLLDDLERLLRAARLGGAAR